MSRLWSWWLRFVERHIVADDPWEAEDRRRQELARHPAMRARWAEACPVCGRPIARGPVDEHICSTRLADAPPLDVIRVAHAAMRVAHEAGVTPVEWRVTSDVARWLTSQVGDPLRLFGLPVVVDDDCGGLVLR